MDVEEFAFPFEKTIVRLQPVVVPAGNHLNPFDKFCWDISASTCQLPFFRERKSEIGHNRLGGVSTQSTGFELDKLSMKSMISISSLSPPFLAWPSPWHFEPPFAISCGGWQWKHVQSPLSSLEPLGTPFWVGRKCDLTSNWGINLDDFEEAGQ